MTRCDESMLSRYLDSELSLAQRGELERHLAVCDRCLREVQTLRSMDRLLRRWGTRREPIPVPTERRLQRSIETKPSRLSSILALGRLMPAAFGTTAAALLVLVTVNLGSYTGGTGAGRHDMAPSRNALERVSAPLVKARRVSAILGARPSVSPSLVQKRRGDFSIQ
jgi:anti-sigma factor RsiW